MCPKCGGKAETVETRSDRKIIKAVYRRRRCMACGHKFTTYELPKSEYKKMYDVYVSFEGLSRRFFGG